MVRVMVTAGSSSEVYMSPVSETRWVITHHALYGYLERSASTATDEEGRAELKALLREAVHVGVHDTSPPAERGELLGAPSRAEAVKRRGITPPASADPRPMQSIPRDPTLPTTGPIRAVVVDPRTLMAKHRPAAST